MSRYTFELALNAETPEKAQELVDIVRAEVNKQVTLDRFSEIAAQFGTLSTAEGQQVRTGGCWIAYHQDWSGFGMFRTELDALRYAVERSMTVVFYEWGEVR